MRDAKRVRANTPEINQLATMENHQLPKTQIAIKQPKPEYIQPKLSNNYPNPGPKTNSQQLATTA